MKLIGVTGTSGSGKSTVCHILEERYGAEIMDADKVAKELSRKGSFYMRSIVQYFGEDILNKEGQLNRKKLAGMIYEDENKREKLNRLTFTYVVDEIKKRIGKINQKKIIVIDAPLLFESGLNTICDFVIAIIAKEEIKIDRICKRDSISIEEAKKRLAVQQTDEFFKDNADYVIKNEQGIEQIEKELSAIL